MVQAKSDLEGQVEIMAADIKIKDLRIQELENFNQNFSQIAKEESKILTQNDQSPVEEDKTLTRHLRAILSPCQFRKIRDYLKNTDEKHVKLFPCYERNLTDAK